MQLTEEIEHKEKKTKSGIEIWPKTIGFMLENFVGYSTVQYATSELLQDFIFMQIKLISKKGFALTVASFWKRELLELKNGIFNQFEIAKHNVMYKSRNNGKQIHRKN